MVQRAREGQTAKGPGIRGRRTRMRALAYALSLLLGFGLVVLTAPMAGPSLAVEPDEVLKDPKLEARARKISAELRCLVCQNQSIDDSNAPLARDLRILLRERLKAGDSDEDAVQFIVARYGEFVLLRPRFGAHTLLLWLATPLILILAAFLVWRGYRSRGGGGETAERMIGLTEEERKALDRLLGDGDEEGNSASST